MIAKAAAKSAALRVKFEHVKQQSQLEYEQMILNRRRREAVIQAEPAAPRRGAVDLFATE